MAKLTPKQQLFVAEYLSCLNAAEAARRAKYSAKTARQQGQRLLTNVDIAAAVQTGLAEMAMPSEEVLARLAEHARGTMDDFLDEVGDIDIGRARERSKMHLVKTRAITKEGERIELYDAQAALALLGKYHGLFADKIEHSGQVRHFVVDIDSDGSA